MGADGTYDDYACFRSLSSTNGGKKQGTNNKKWIQEFYELGSNENKVVIGFVYF